MGFAIPAGKHNIGEHQWVGVQRTKDSWGVHRGDIPNASTNGLSLDMEVRLGRVPRVSNLAIG
jgi:hypothetical protein